MSIAFQATVLFNCVPRNEWVHENGDEYKVLHLTNLRAEHTDFFPPTVVYQQIDTGDLWSRPLADFIRQTAPKDWGSSGLCLWENYRHLRETLTTEENAHGQP